MMRGMFAAISGLKQHQTMLDVTANNLANVNTIGYKAARTTFKDQLSQLQRGAAGTAQGLGGSNAAQVGLGVALGSIDNLMTGGALQPTGNPLDVAIQGEGWLRISQATGNPPTPNGAVEYTRAGNLTTDSQGYLVTQEGWYVLGVGAPGTGTAGQKALQIPPGSSNVSISTDGAVRYTDPSGNPAVAGYLSLAKFANEAGLMRASGSRWTASPSSGAEQVATPGGTYGQTIGGTLEMSNVELAQEFTNMITAERGFEANSRVITTADQMLQQLVNMVQ